MCATGVERAVGVCCFVASPRVPLVLESTALWSSSRVWGKKKGKKTQSSSCTASSGNENVPGPVSTASSSKKGLTSHGL